MMERRVTKLEETIVELDARCLMHDIMIGHLLGSLGSTSGDMRGFVSSLIHQVGLDLKENGIRALGTSDAQRYADALKVLEYFSGSLIGSLDRAHQKGLN
ncbi:hypothetical protein HGP17_09215 [Rhizobium sp. P38BS-XIX]|uniref:hypothetical protein n=1 Tax=Rhizobium sp. P38BS-XIX TaxID=2726740 RepID=UPI00145683A0|nr:hypothetical protein [Rhizobium sp. P38BS-XIX]NLR97014.1 hypothetical protein [Rhizobium sp. P38BS-XIX]